MNTSAAYAKNVRFESFQYGEYNVIDEAMSVGRKNPVIIGHVSVIRGFGHFTGSRYYPHMKGIKAVVRLSGGGDMTQIEESLKFGLRSGRDDRK